jgi:hypothetical protein
MSIIDPAEAIVAGYVVIPRMRPLRRWLQNNDVFVIIQLFPTGLTLQRNTLQIWTKTKTKTGPLKKSGLGGQSLSPDLEQKNNNNKGLVKALTH